MKPLSMLKPSSLLTSKFVCYLLIGACNTLVCLLVMYLGASFSLNYLEYTVLGYLVAIVFSFFMNLHYTFRVEGQTLKRLALFFLVNLTNLVIVELIEYTLIESYAIHHLIAIFCGMSWYILAGFILSNSLVYRSKVQASYD